MNTRLSSLFARVLLVLAGAASLACSERAEPADPGEVVVRERECKIPEGTAAPDYIEDIGCRSDFDALASLPLDTSIPGARSVKVVLDRLDPAGDRLYFQNSQKYAIHYDFVSEHLSWFEPLSSFNSEMYYSTDRRFVLGSVTYYEAADAWTVELAPYDNASADLTKRLYSAVKKQAYFGPALKFHPTSDAIERAAESLPKSVRVITTDELFASIAYQPLNLGTVIGRLRFLTAAQLETQYVGFRDIVVLDAVPNDISVVMGLITQEFQTPLSHVNVLAQNRGTPNMGLRDAMKNEDLRALEGKWVELDVGAFAWTAREATEEEADAFWDEKRPEPVTLPELDFETRDLRDIEGVVDESDGLNLGVIQRGILAFGAKAANYSVLVKIGDAVPIRKAFAVPVFYYDQFMKENGFYDRVVSLRADPDFENDPVVREAELSRLREDMEVAPVNQDFQDELAAKMEADYPGLSMRFRTSTNAEDLDGFPCAGCYDSQTGDPAKGWEDVLTAVRKTWAGVWFFRTYEEREYHGIDHNTVGMALLVHHNFPGEEANGVALTANPFDPSGLEPGFYVNVQTGGAAEVVHPPPGVTSDQFIYYFDSQGQTATYLAHSNLVPEGETVLTRAQTFQLGTALEAIHRKFSPAFGPGAGNNGWYAMDVEFKYDDEGSPDGSVSLWIKQARPHPGRGE
ncbi:MAG TPA: PEP/pyruvate-binding domain-containing protein [Polyangiaceae bacterium]